jgi:hypothetical protein
MEVDLDMVESARQLEHPPWIGDNVENENTQMTAIPKGTATARIKAEMEQTIADGGPSRVRNNLFKKKYTPEETLR